MKRPRTVPLEGYAPGRLTRRRILVALLYRELRGLDAPTWPELEEDVGVGVRQHVERLAELGLLDRPDGGTRLTPAGRWAAEQLHELGAL